VGLDKSKSYRVTIWLTVTDSKALKRAAMELAEAIEMPGRETRRNTRDDLLMLIDPGEIPGVRVLGTVVDQIDSVPVS
jgi:hypothetical protein